MEEKQVQKKSMANMKRSSVALYSSDRNLLRPIAKQTNKLSPQIKNKESIFDFDFQYPAVSMILQDDDEEEKESPIIQSQKQDIDAKQLQFRLQNNSTGQIIINGNNNPDKSKEAQQLQEAVVEKSYEEQVSIALSMLDLFGKGTNENELQQEQQQLQQIQVNQQQDNETKKSPESSKKQPVVQKQRGLILERSLRSVLNEFPYIIKYNNQRPGIDLRLASKVNYLKVSKGQTIIFQNDKPDNFYFIVRGSMVVLGLQKHTQIEQQRIANSELTYFYSNLVSNFAQSEQLRLEKAKQNQVIPAAQFQSKFMVLLETNLNMFSQDAQQQPINSIFNLNLTELKKNTKNPNNASSVTTNNNGSINNNVPISNTNENHNDNDNQKKLDFDQAASSVNASSPANNLEKIDQSTVKQVMSNFGLPNSISINTVATTQIPNLAINTPKGTQTPSAANNSQPSLDSPNFIMIANQPVPKDPDICDQFSLKMSQLKKIDHFYDSGVFRYNFYKLMKSKEHVGDRGLLKDQVRSATVLAIQDTDLFYVTKQDYQVFFKTLENSRVQQIMNFLKLATNKMLTTIEINRISYDIQDSKYQIVPRVKLFQEGDPLENFYLIQKGEVVISQQVEQTNVAQKIQSFKRIIDMDLFKLGPYEFVGVQDYLQGNQTYSCSARTDTFTTYYLFKKPVLSKIFSDHPNVRTVLEDQYQSHAIWEDDFVQSLKEQQQIEIQITDDTTEKIPSLAQNVSNQAIYLSPEIFQRIQRKKAIITQKNGNKSLRSDDQLVDSTISYGEQANINPISQLSFTFQDKDPPLIGSNSFQIQASFNLEDRRQSLIHQKKSSFPHILIENNDFSTGSITQIGQQPIDMQKSKSSTIHNSFFLSQINEGSNISLAPFASPKMSNPDMFMIYNEINSFGDLRAAMSTASNINNNNQLFMTHNNGFPVSRKTGGTTALSSSILNSTSYDGGRFRKLGSQPPSLFNSLNTSKEDISSAALGSGDELLIHQNYKHKLQKKYFIRSNQRFINKFHSLSNSMVNNQQSPQNDINPQKEAEPKNGKFGKLQFENVHTLKNSKHILKRKDFDPLGIRETKIPSQKQQQHSFQIDIEDDPDYDFEQFQHVGSLGELNDDNLTKQRNQSAEDNEFFKVEDDDQSEHNQQIIISNGNQGFWLADDLNMNIQHIMHNIIKLKWPKVFAEVTDPKNQFPKSFQNQIFQQNEVTTNPQTILKRKLNQAKSQINLKNQQNQSHLEKYSNKPDSIQQKIDKQQDVFEELVQSRFSIKQYHNLFTDVKNPLSDKCHQQGGSQPGTNLSLLLKSKDKTNFSTQNIFNQTCFTNLNNK